MRPGIASIVFVGVVAVAACERSSDAPESFVEPAPVQVPGEVEPEHEAEEMEADLERPPAAEFLTWPGREEYMTFELMWLGGDQELALYAEPDSEADVVEMASFFDGDQLSWSETRVLVMEPRPFRVEEYLEWGGIPYDAEYMELEAAEQRFDLVPGDIIYLYQYGGEGTCFVGIEEEIVLGGCPGAEFDVDKTDETDEYYEKGGEEFDEERPWYPLRRQWWVRVDADSVDGWLLVDDAPVEVHPRKIEGFDSWDGYESDEPG